MSKPFARAVVVASALLLGAAPVVAPAAAARASQVRTFGYSDSGRTVHVSKGATFKVRLKGCGDCGDYWSFSHRPDKAVVKVVSRRVVAAAKPPAVGGYDHTIWTMKAVGRGTTTMRMAEHSASQHGKVIKRFSLTVKVS